MQLERIDMYYLQGKAAALAESRPWLTPYLSVRRTLRLVRGQMVSRAGMRPPAARSQNL